MREFILRHQRKIESGVAQAMVLAIPLVLVTSILTIVAYLKGWI